MNLLCIWIYPLILLIPSLHCFLLIILHCILSTGIRAVPAICHRVSPLLIWNWKHKHRLIKSIHSHRIINIIWCCGAFISLPLSIHSVLFSLGVFLVCCGSKLQFSKLPAEVPVMFRVVELPQKHHICKVKSLNKGDANSEVTVYYQVNRKSSLFL